MTTSFGQYNLPLRVKVVDTVFSHPQNFVKIQKKDSKRGKQTTIDDDAGAWLNQAVGGDTNTIDLHLQLLDSTDKPVMLDECIPLKVLLFYSIHEKPVDMPIDEVNQSTPEDKSGKRTGSRKILMVSSKQRSLLSLKKNGKGLVCVRILETSTLHERKKFCIEVVPDTDDEKLKMLFHTLSGGTYSAADDAEEEKIRKLRNNSVSWSLTVMSKINKTSRGDVASKVHNQLSVAAKLLKPARNHDMKLDALKMLLEKCDIVRQLLLHAAEVKNFNLENTATSSTTPTGTTTATQTNISLHVDKKPKLVLDPHTTTTTSIPTTEAPQEQTPVSEIVEPNIPIPEVSTPPVVVEHRTPSVEARKRTREEASIAFDAGRDFLNDFMIPTDGGHSNEFLELTGDSFPEFMNLFHDNPLRAINVVSCNISPEALFFTLDVSKEGFLNEGEVADALRVLRIPLSSKIAKAFMHACDRDKDGKVSKVEFLEYLTEREAQLRKAFNEIDTDQDGFITYEELVAARERNLVDGSDQELQALIDWMNSLEGSKNDNRIEFEEFKTSLTLLPPSTTLSNVIKLMSQGKA